MTHRIIQLTDCHLFADPKQELRGIATWQRFLAALSDLRCRNLKVDLLVMTGDTAHDELNATYEAVRHELLDWADRVRVIPGNHDSRSDLQGVFPALPAGPLGRVTFHDLWDDWQVLGLDSQRPGELPGSLGAEQLDWLRRILDASPGLSTLLLMHHPPISVGSPWLDRIGLLDAAEFERLLRGHPQVRLVGCGHVHQEVVASLGKATVFTTPSVGPAFRPRTAELEIDSALPAYRIWEFSTGESWATQVLQCRNT